MDKRYEKSEEWLERALRTIPLGSQTFSKSKTQFPFGVSPYFIERGEGSHTWDVDGNEYIDFVNGLASVTLGYNDPDVNARVADQLKKGVTFSLPHRLEAEVAEKIVKMVPSAEMVRFGKNGSDATAGAVRLARAYTGRDHVAVCGYHGWQDWYIGSTARHKGVPEIVRSLTHKFTFNDLASLEAVFQAFPGQLAAVILEPMNVAEPAPGFLEGVKELAHKNNAVLIFDETITGFRFAIGGAQELFGVLPDLTTLGKGLANGFPLSAVVGKREIMMLMEEIFFSVTFGGETLSLAAAAATLDKLVSDRVTERIAATGKRVKSGLQQLIVSHGAESFLSVSGHPSWSFLGIRGFGSYSQWQIKTFLLQELFARGILSIGTHNMCFSHSEGDVEKLLSAYNEILPVLTNAVRTGKLESVLKCEALEPLFKVR